MTITLRDIRGAVEDYLNGFVTTNVTPVQPDPNSPGTINPNEFGTFKIDFFNATEPNGVPLLNVRHHLTFENEVGAFFEVPNTPPAHSGTLVSSALLSPGSLVKSMVLYLGDFDIGTIDEVSLRVKAPNTNVDVTIQCHSHAEPDQAFLFPPGERNRTGSRTFSVV